MIIRRYVLAIILFITGTVFSNNYLTRKQVESYINHVVDTLLLPQASGCFSEITSFKRELQSKVIAQLGRSSWIIYTRYESDRVYEVVLGEIEQFIEEQAYKYACEELTHNFSTFSNKQALAQKIKKIIYQEVHTLILSSTYLDDGRLAQYIGQSLRNKIRALVMQQIPNPWAGPAVLYSSPECPVCLEQFDITVQRIYLDCGHNICPGCLKKWHEKNRALTNCPLCSHPVAIHKYAHLLWPPSAPPLE